jgi:GNAT superfamily N-acetyltransferase
MAPGDPAVMANAFRATGWPSKSVALFDRYLREQEEGARAVLVAFVAGEFAGYVTVQWEPSYPPLAAAGTPELQDLNVLPSFRRRRIGTRLVDHAEDLVKARSEEVGIGVGLHPGYNAAQRMYVRRGYRARRPNAGG